MSANLAALLALGIAASATPSGSSVPANLLRIELRFDQRLAALDMRYVHLLDASGQPIDGALLDIALPDNAGRGFAVLMHPGRIKRGVGPNLAVGPALTEGGYVTLLVDDPRLARPLTRHWRIAAPLRQALAPASWRLQRPLIGSRQALRIGFGSAINASGVALIGIATSRGERVKGSAALVAGETEWRFTPTSPWKAGAYQVRVHSSLEDPAGNRICSAFEQRHQSSAHCDTEARIEFQLTRGAHDE